MLDDLDEMIREAFRIALDEIGLGGSVRVTDVLPYPDSDRFAIHLRKQDGQYLYPHIDPTEVLSDIGGGRLTVDAFKKFAHRELQTHFPNSY
jgi:hypothetical protein